MRVDKAQKYLKMAKFMANEFSKDPSTKVGAIFLRPETYEILATGYNGFPRKIDETDQNRWKRPQKYFYVEHAERNAIYNAARSGTSLLNSICIVTLFPCCDCARGIIQTGVSLVIVEKSVKASDKWKDQWEISKEMFKEAGVQVMEI